MYYGEPFSEDYTIYGDNEDGKNLVLSYECDDLCYAIAEAFEYEYKWLDIARENKIMLEKVFEVDVEKQELIVVASLLLYLVVSITFEDKFIDALNNGFLIRLIRRLEQLVLWQIKMV